MDDEATAIDPATATADDFLRVADELDEAWDRDPYEVDVNPGWVAAMLRRAAELIRSADASD